MAPPCGCRFRTRCPEVFEPCDRIDPSLQNVGDRHCAACLQHGLIGESDPRHGDVGAAVGAQDGAKNRDP
jgi:hypothetical protein